MVEHDINRASKQNHLQPGCSTSRRGEMEKPRSTFALTKHAILRMAQRNVSLSDLEYVLEHGDRIYRTGITIYILRMRDILQNDRKNYAITRLQGTVVLTAFTQDGRLEIITIYRNQSARKDIRSKAKYDRRSRYRTSRIWSRPKDGKLQRETLVTLRSEEQGGNGCLACLLPLLGAGLFWKGNAIAFWKRVPIIESE